MKKSLRTRGIYTPSVTDLATQESKRAFWKQILPKKQIDYTGKDGARHKIDFDDAYLADLAKMDGVDSVGFLLADKDNAHTMDPERWRANVTQMEVRDDGLYGRFEFPTAKAARAVMANPNLGVSARIREGIQKSDGSTVSRGIIHVLGTLDPQVSGMSPWQAADLSKSEDDVLDLSNETFKEGEHMAKKTAKKTEATDYSPEDIDAMTEAELDAFLAEFAPEFVDTLDNEADDDLEDDDDEDDDLDDEPQNSHELAGAGANLSKSAKRDIELANQTAANATARANEALKRMAEAEWKSYRDVSLSKGIPPHLLDLAKPVLNRPDEMVIDLSNSGESDVNVSAIVKGLLESCEGMVDLSNESGHSGLDLSNGGEDPDKAILDLWADQTK